MAAPKIEMYVRLRCPYVDRARELLARKGTLYTEIDIEGHPERRAEMIRRSGRHTVPQIFVADRRIGDCEEIEALEMAGHLDAMLAGR